MNQYRPSDYVVRVVQALMVVISLGVAGCAATSDDFSSDIESIESGSADDGVGSELVLTARDLTYSSLLASHGPPLEHYQTIRECMNEQGFEYVVPPPPESIIPRDQMTELIQDAYTLDPTSSLFRNRYGYGVTTIEAYIADYIEPVDRNAELQAEMTDAERRAWNTALVGPDLAKYFDPEYLPTAEELSGEFGTTEFGGCTKEANDAVGLDYEQLREQSEEFVEAIERIESSEGFVELGQDWAQCAAEKGYSNLTWFGSATPFLEERLREIARPNPFPNLHDEGMVTLTEDEFQQLNEWHREKYPQEDLARVQQEELDLAQHLKDCDIAYWTGFAEIEDSLSTDG